MVKTSPAKTGTIMHRINPLPAWHIQIFTHLKLCLATATHMREMPQSFIIKLYSETQVSGRLGMSGGISPRHAQNPLSGERRKTLSITHHALSPPPSHHHMYIIHLINWLQRFYRIIMSLKRPFVPKSDVKQWFTTTTTTATHNFKWVKITHICLIWDKTFADLYV